MPSYVAAIAFVFLILGLFWLDRDAKSRTSVALWVPVIWLSLAGSRQVSQWLQWAPTSGGGSDQYLEGSPLDRLVYSGLVAAGLVILISRRRRVWKLLRANGPILLFFLYCAASILWSDYTDVALKRWIKASGDFIMVLVVLSDREPSAAVKRLLARAGCILIPLSVLLIKYYPALGRIYGRWDWKTYYTGVTTNKNTLGVICLLFGLASLWRFLVAYRDGKDKARVRHLIAHGMILAMVLWLFTLAGSMTALCAFLMGSGLLLATSARTSARRPAVVHLLVAGMISGSAFVLFFGVSPILEALGKDSTLTDRTEIWSLLYGMVASPLIGTGFESFWLGPRLEAVWKVYSWGPNQAHNGYIEVFLNLGWIGVALLAVVIATGYMTVFSAFRKRLPLGDLMLAYFVVGVIYNFTEAALFRMMAPAWIVLLLAMIKVPEWEAVPLGKRVIAFQALRWRPFVLQATEELQHPVASLRLAGDRQHPLRSAAPIAHPRARSPWTAV